MILPSPDELVIDRCTGRSTWLFEFVCQCNRRVECLFWLVNFELPSAMRGFSTSLARLTAFDCTRSGDPMK